MSKTTNFILPMLAIGSAAFIGFVVYDKYLKVKQEEQACLGDIGSDPFHLPVFGQSTGGGCSFDRDMEVDYIISLEKVSKLELDITLDALQKAEAGVVSILGEQSNSFYRMKVLVRAGKYIPSWIDVDYTTPPEVVR